MLDARQIGPHFSAPASNTEHSVPHLSSQHLHGDRILHAAQGPARYQLGGRPEAGSENGGGDGYRMAERAAQVGDQRLRIACNQRL